MTFDTKKARWGYVCLLKKGEFLYSALEPVPADNCQYREATEFEVQMAREITILRNSNAMAYRELTEATESLSRLRLLVSRLDRDPEIAPIINRVRDGHYTPLDPHSS